jgi:Flp pilus assembly protein TadG
MYDRIVCRGALAKLVRNRRGSAAVEFAMVATLLMAGVLNAVDLSYYLFTRMQVENAAEMGAQAAWKACDPAALPATRNCPRLTAAVSAAVQSTALGARVSLLPGSPTEGYYCVDASNALQPVGTLSSKPVDCSAAGDASVQPGDYLQVQVTSVYTPLFPGISAIGATGIGSIAATSWMRLG